MRDVRSVALAAALSALAFGAPVALGEDQEAPVSEAQKAAAESPPKSRSNIINNREAGPAPARDDVEPKKPDEVLKTKTRSNQSNDRVAPPAEVVDEAAPKEPEALLKSKTKSNQSND
jgi:hypothetical protein